MLLISTVRGKRKATEKCTRSSWFKKIYIATATYLVTVKRLKTNPIGKNSEPPITNQTLEDPNSMPAAQRVTRARQVEREERPRDSDSVLLDSVILIQCC